MSKHKTSQIRENKADRYNGKKTRSLSKLGLWLGARPLALVVAFISLRPGGSDYKQGTDSSTVT
jgi:hypothetical protein